MNTKTGPDPFASNTKYERVNDLEGFFMADRTIYGGIEVRF
jgi:hypothetical protein